MLTIFLAKICTQISSAGAQDIPDDITFSRKENRKDLVDDSSHRHCRRDTTDQGPLTKKEGQDHDNTGERQDEKTTQNQNPKNQPPINHYGQFLFHVSPPGLVYLKCQRAKTEASYIKNYC